MAVRLPNLHPVTDPLIERAIRAGFVGPCGEMLQQPDEISQFVQWLPTVLPVWPPPIILEIGSHTGASTCMWAELATRQVVAIDLPNGYGGGIDQLATAQRDQIFHDRYPHTSWVLGDSQQVSTIHVVRSLLGGPIDLLFIDGDHSAAGVTADYLNYRDFVRPGGVIAFHDITGAPAVTALFASIPGEKHRFQVAGSPWGGIGAIVS